MRMMLAASLCKQLKPVLGKTLNHRKKAMGAIDGLFADSSNDQLIGHTIDLGPVNGRFKLDPQSSSDESHSCLVGVKT